MTKYEKVLTRKPTAWYMTKQTIKNMTDKQWQPLNNWLMPWDYYDIT